MHWEQKEYFTQGAHSSLLVLQHDKHSNCNVYKALQYQALYLKCKHNVQCTSDYFAVFTMFFCTDMSCRYDAEWNYQRTNPFSSEHSSPADIFPPSYHQPGFNLTEYCYMYVSARNIASKIVSTQKAVALPSLTDWKTIDRWWTMKMNGILPYRMSRWTNEFQGRFSSFQWAFPSLCFSINHVNLLIFKFIHF